MTDTLRTRITAVIDGVWQSGYPDAPADALADAVIEALKLDTVVRCAREWYKDYDTTPANDPRDPSDVDIAYDDAGYQILVALGLEKPVFP